MPNGGTPYYQALYDSFKLYLIVFEAGDIEVLNINRQRTSVVTSSAKYYVIDNTTWRRENFEL